MVKPLLARLAKLEEHFDVPGALAEAEAAQHHSELIRSDETATNLAIQYERTIARACERNTELRALRGDISAFVHQLDTPTLCKMRDEAQLLEDRLEWLREQRKEPQP